jgi:hypothetical protein
MSYKQYRRKYKDYYNIDFDEEYVIHHIDFDKTNDDIENLLLLPRDLHLRYHSIVANLEMSSNHSCSLLIGEIGSYEVEAFKRYAEVLAEIYKWQKWKQYDYDQSIYEFIFN